MTDQPTTWSGTARRDRLWRRNIEALRIWTITTGDPMAPINTTVTHDGEEVRLGSFVAYVRQRYRDGLLEESRVNELEQLAGWTWGGLRPGPRGHAARNEQIRQLRREGVTLEELAEQFQMSRQRIHQIAPDRPDPVKHKARLESRRAAKKRRLEAQREAIARRGGAS